MDHTQLSFLALGGLGRIGMNNLVLRWREHRWLIDCGVMFPDERTRFADKVLPDLGWLRAQRGSLRGIVLTHGHEDHIGAIPFVLGLCPMPVYGSPFTLGLVRRRLEEHGISGDLRLLEPGMEVVRPPESPELGFRLLRVTHSIPDAASLVVETPVGRVLHTGDFKIDPEPMDGEALDVEGFRELGDSGVLLMLSDSTNASVPGSNASERSVVDGIASLVAGHPGRVIVCQFSSNLHRLRGMEEVAARTGRRLCLVGRSLHSYSEVARNAGLLSIDASGLLRAEALESTDPSSVLVVITGSQAESRAGLMRAALDDSPFLKVRHGDLIILSARIIPGNEAAIHSMISELCRRGARVIHRAPNIHTSGHARRDELEHLIRLVRPQHFVPVHGEYAFLHDHAELARSCGVPDVLVATNGEEFDIGPDGLRRIAEHDLVTHFHDGNVTGTEDELRFDDRRRIFHHGVVAATLSVRGRSPLSCDVELRSLGVYTADGRLLDQAADAVAADLRTLPGSPSDEALEDACATSVRRFFRKTVGKKPHVIPFVVHTPAPGG